MPLAVAPKLWRWISTRSALQHCPCPWHAQKHACPGFCQSQQQTVILHKWRKVSGGPQVCLLHPSFATLLPVRLHACVLALHTLYQAVTVHLGGQTACEGMVDGMRYSSIKWGCMHQCIFGCIEGIEGMHLHIASTSRIASTLAAALWAHQLTTAAEVYPAALCAICHLIYWRRSNKAISSASAA
jgi:hypothetical protein